MLTSLWQPHDPTRESPSMEGLRDFYHRLGEQLNDDPGILTWIVGVLNELGSCYSGLSPTRPRAMLARSCFMAAVWMARNRISVTVAVRLDLWLELSRLLYILGESRESLFYAQETLTLANQLEALLSKKTTERVVSSSDLVSLLKTPKENLEWIRQSQAFAHYRAGWAYNQSGEWQRSIDSMRQALKVGLDPESDYSARLLIGWNFYELIKNQSQETPAMTTSLNNVMKDLDELIRANGSSTTLFEAAALKRLIDSKQQQWEEHFDRALSGLVSGCATMIGLQAADEDGVPELVNAMPGNHEAVQSLLQDDPGFVDRVRTSYDALAKLLDGLGRTQEAADLRHALDDLIPPAPERRPPTSLPATAAAPATTALNGENRAAENGKKKREQRDHDERIHREAAERQREVPPEQQAQSAWEKIQVNDRAGLDNFFKQDFWKKSLPLERKVEMLIQWAPGFLARKKGISFKERQNSIIRFIEEARIIVVEDSVGKEALISIPEATLKELRAALLNGLEGNLNGGLKHLGTQYRGIDSARRGLMNQLGPALELAKQHREKEVRELQELLEKKGGLEDLERRLTQALDDFKNHRLPDARLKLESQEKSLHTARRRHEEEALQQQERESQRAQLQAQAERAAASRAAVHTLVEDLKTLFEKGEGVAEQTRQWLERLDYVLPDLGDRLTSENIWKVNESREDISAALAGGVQNDILLAFYWNLNVLNHHLFFPIARRWFWLEFDQGYDGFRAVHADHALMVQWMPLSGEELSLSHPLEGPIDAFTFLLTEENHTARYWHDTQRLAILSKTRLKKLIGDETASPAKSLSARELWESKRRIVKRALVLLLGRVIDTMVIRPPDGLRARKLLGLEGAITGSALRRLRPTEEELLTIAQSYRRILYSDSRKDFDRSRRRIYEHSYGRGMPDRVAIFMKNDGLSNPGLVWDLLPFREALRQFQLMIQKHLVLPTEGGILPHWNKESGFSLGNRTHDLRQEILKTLDLDHWDQARSGAA